MKPNYFLKVSKELFAIGLNPTEILIVSQVLEFQVNTGDCFISDKVLAENFCVSESTITRTLKALETKGIIARSTKNVKGGKERHLSVNTNKLNELITTRKMPVDNSLQPSNCLLSTVNLLVDNKQNDLIKDNIKDKEKDNIDGVKLPKGSYNPFSDGQKEEELEEISVDALVKMCARHTIVGDNKVLMLDTGKMFRLKGY